MSRLTPLPIEILEGVSVPMAQSPFPVFGHAPKPIPGTTGAEIAGVDAQRMDKLERLLKEAQGRAETVEREAYDKAYATGERAGLALGEKRAEQILEAMEEALKQAEEEGSRMRQSCIDAVVDIAQIIVEQLTGEILEQHKDALYKAAKRAALQLPEVSQLKLVVNPDDMQSFERLMQEENSQWRLTADPSVAQGTCRLVSKHQDAFIDPVRAVADSVRQIRVALHSGSIYPAPDTEDAGSANQS